LQNLSCPFKGKKFIKTQAAKRHQSSAIPSLYEFLIGKKEFLSIFSPKDN
jgi:hypothetical protein